MSNIELNQKIEALKAYAKSTDITYETISERSGIPVSTLKKIFSGKTSNPRLDTVQAIERALGLNEKSPANNGEANSNLNIPEKYSGIRVALNEGDKNLTQDDIDDIVRFIEFTANKNKK